MEIKNKLTVTRGEGGGDNRGGDNGKGHQRVCIKDTGTNQKGDRIEGGRQGLMGRGRLVGGKWRQLYLNNNKKKIKENRDVDDFTGEFYQNIQK